MPSNAGRRRVLKTGAAAGALALSAPFIRPSWAATGPIKIGMVIPFTGATGAYGPEMEKAAKLVVKAINDGGGLLDDRTAASADGTAGDVSVSGGSVRAQSSGGDVSLSAGSVSLSGVCLAVPRSRVWCVQM